MRVKSDGSALQSDMAVIVGREIRFESDDSSLAIVR